MQFWQLLTIIAIITSATAAGVAIVAGSSRRSLNKSQNAKKAAAKAEMDYTQAALRDVEHIFNDEFREELRNRGRLHFEKIIGDNAMFLQQDLRLTTSQLSEYMKSEITRTLKEEFAKYEQSIADAKQLAIDSIAKTQQAIEEQREILGRQLQEQVATEKERLLNHFEQNMADIINHYVLAAIGNQIDLNDQLEYILGDLKQNKQAIIEDIRNGA